MTKGSDSSNLYSKEATKVIGNPHSALVSHWLTLQRFPKFRAFYGSRLRNIEDATELTGEIKAIRHSPRINPAHNPGFTFVDLFAGIGGMRLAGEKNGGLCVFSSEWDKYAQQTYFRNFGEIPFGDIRQIDESDIPKHDLMFAGFPCQSFSIAGRREGFDDIRGTMFFEIARIIEAKQPQVVILENVKGLRGHDGGETLRKILETLRDELGYFVPDPAVLNSKRFSVPQNRDRIFIVAFKKKSASERFRYPLGTTPHRTVADIRETSIVPAKYFLRKSTLKMLEDHRDRHRNKGNGFGMHVLENNAISNAIVVGGMGRERNLLVDSRSGSKIAEVERRFLGLNLKNIRRMTPREFARLQGFPESFRIPVSDSQAYKQFGNSVTVHLVAAVVKEVLRAI